ncbi:MAG: type VI secretion system tip protein TssI/VgrG, partial [Planctomycetota bacterium]
MLRQPDASVRELSIECPFGKDVVLRSIEGVESISAMFSFDLELLSGCHDLSATDIIGRTITFSIRRADGQPRYFNGRVNRFAHVDQDANGSTYRASVAPWLWFLTQTSDCRIFQNLDVTEILETLFGEFDFSDYRFELAGDYAKREFCVQYRESAFAFFSRLAEQEGIFYWFEHHERGHTLVLSDRMASYRPIEEERVDYGDPTGAGDLTDQLTSWNRNYRFHCGRVTTRDFNFQIPSSDLSASQPAKTDLVHQRTLERFDYPGRFDEHDLGSRRTAVQMEAEEADYDQVVGSGNYRSFAAGQTFAIRSHLAAHEVGREYLITEVTHQASEGGTYITGTDRGEANYTNRFRAVPADVIIRPSRRTPLPVVEGIQTAMVVGPPDEEIHTDQFGRVKVQFPWDRRGKSDDGSSCWMRVSQIHAGHGWGHMDLPRVGEDVVVSFLNGDPDRPIIKGRVYNGANRPPFGLPAGKTRSDGKTDTYQGTGANEMSMDDSLGAEQLRVNAQYDMDTVINESETLTVGVDRKTEVGNDDSLSIGVDAAEEIGNDKSVKVGNDDNIAAANDIEIEVGTSISLTVGSSSLKMNQGGVIKINGEFVTSAAMAANTTVAPLTKIVGEKSLIQAAPVCMDLSWTKHIKGKATAELAGANADVDGSDVVVVKGCPIRIGDAGMPMVSLPPPKNSPAPSPVPTPAPGPVTGPSPGPVLLPGSSPSSDLPLATAEDAEQMGKIRDRIHEVQEEIIELDDAFESGGLSQEEYDRRRATLSAEEEQLFREHTELSTTRFWPDDDEIPPEGNDVPPSPEDAPADEKT